jgi:hypothetical protein
VEGTSSTGRKSEFSQKGEFADALRWERFTDLKVRVGEAILNFLLQSGKDTGGEMFLDERAEKWKETRPLPPLTKLSRFSRAFSVMPGRCQL